MKKWQLPGGRACWALASSAPDSNLRWASKLSCTAAVLDRPSCWSRRKTLWAKRGRCRPTAAGKNTKSISGTTPIGLIGYRVAFDVQRLVPLVLSLFLVQFRQTGAAYDVVIRHERQQSRPRHPEFLPLYLCVMDINENFKSFLGKTKTKLRQTSESSLVPLSGTEALRKWSPKNLEWESSSISIVVVNVLPLLDVGFWLGDFSNVLCGPE